MNVTTGNIFEISTPQYPYFYPHNIECTWQFVSSSMNTAGSYAIHFLEFHTHEHDDLIIGKGLARMSSANDVLQTFPALVPSHVVVVIEQPAIWLMFQSNVAISFTGFSLMIERNQDTGECTVV